MKLKQTSLTLIAAALAFGLIGCSKNEPATTAVEDSNKIAEAAKAEAAKTTEAAKTAESAKVETAKVAATEKADELINKAKSLIAENKVSDASSVLQELAGQSLTSEQTKLVDELKAQIQKALVAKAAESASGLGDNLPKK